MANAVYPIWKENLLQATANTDLDQTGTDGVYCALVTAGYTYSAAHNFFDDVASTTANIVGTDQEIGATKSYTNGTFDGADVTYSSVSGSQVTQLVLYRKNSGANSTWYLVLFLNTSVTGLPVTPNGGDITVQWNGSGIFTLSDARVKEDIVEIGKVGRGDKVLSLCEYRYVHQKTRQVGLVAQEVEQKVPAAVVDVGGLKMVNYDHALAWARAA